MIPHITEAEFDAIPIDSSTILNVCFINETDTFGIIIGGPGGPVKDQFKTREAALEWASQNGYTHWSSEYF